MAEQLLVNHLLLPAATVALVAGVMFGKVDQARAVLAARETLHRHHQLKVQMVAQAVLISRLIQIYKQAVEAELVKLVKLAKQLLAAREETAPRLQFPVLP